MQVCNHQPVLQAQEQHRRIRGLAELEPRLYHLERLYHN